MNPRFLSFLLIATIWLLLAFPKAGIYVAGVPVTFSYLMLAVTAVAVLVTSVSRGARPSLLVEQRYAWLGALLFLLAGIEATAFMTYGGKSTGISMSIVVSTLVIPVLAMVTGHAALEQLGIERLLRTLRWAVFPVLVFGVASFVVYNVSGKVIGIPFLTTTGNELELVAERHNLRGPIIKMFSTYNNGNILGINLLLWGPLAAIASVPCAFAYRSLCVLTLSRSVWAGLIAYEVLSAVVDRSYRRVFLAMLGGGILMLAVIAASVSIGRDPAKFLLDKDLGGRVTSLQQDLETISHQRIGWDSESAPAAAWLAFGAPGPLLIGLAWSVPIFAGGRTRVHKVARSVLAVYLLVSLVEGAFVLIPTQAVYWLVASIALARPELVEFRSTSARGATSPAWQRRGMSLRVPVKQAGAT